MSKPENFHKNGFSTSSTSPSATATSGARGRPATASTSPEDCQSQQSTEGCQGLKDPTETATEAEADGSEKATSSSQKEEFG